MFWHAVFIFNLAVSATFGASNTPGTPGPIDRNKIGKIHFLDAKSAAIGVKVKDGSGTVRIAHEDEELYLQDLVATGLHQNVQILLQDQSEISLAPFTHLEIVALDPGTSAELLLHEGTLHVVITKDHYAVEKPFVIRTPGSAVGVRGTEFILESPSNGKTSVYTLDGIVAFASNPTNLKSAETSILVQRGRKSTIPPGSNRPSAPRRFNQKTLYNRLDRISPTFSKHVGQVRALRRSQNAIKSVNHPRKKKRTWSPPRLRRHILKR